MFSYSFQSGIGLQPYILKTIKDLMGTENDPFLKIDHLGFINLLKSQKPLINLDRPGGNGAIQFINAKYMQRAVEGQVQTSGDICATANITPYQEVTVPLNIKASYGVFIEEGLMQEYTNDLNQVQSLGLPPTPAMVAVVEQIKGAANAIMTSLDRQLQNAVVFGINPNTGSSAASAINIPLNTTNLPLNQGINEIFAQAQLAQFATGNLQVFGSGLFHRFMNNQVAKTFDQSGYNTKIQAMGIDFFLDQLSTTILGANQIAVVSPDAIQLVEYMQNTGAYAGHKGAVDKGVLMLPMQITPNEVKEVEFDFLLRYLPCASDVASVNDYYGSPITGNSGYQLIISKQCGLFQPPVSAYKASDYLAGSNGILRYTISNS